MLTAFSSRTEELKCLCKIACLGSSVARARTMVARYGVSFITNVVLFKARLGRRSRGLLREVGGPLILCSYRLPSDQCDDMYTSGERVLGDTISCLCGRNTSSVCCFYAKGSGCGCQIHGRTFLGAGSGRSATSTGCVLSLKSRVPEVVRALLS